MNRKNLINKQSGNKNVDLQLLEESIALTKALKKAGMIQRRGYNLRPIFDKRLLKISVSELAAAG